MALTPLDFPASPTVGQLYPDPPVTGQPTYKWDGAQWLSYAAAKPPTPTKPDEYAKKNYIINGAMQVSQENGTTVGTGALPAFYPADQWRPAVTGGGALTLAQIASATPGGSPNRIRVSVTTADTSIGATESIFIAQDIEGLRITDLKPGTANAKTVTLQFGCKGPAGTYGVSFFNGATVNRFYVAEVTITGGEANTDVVKSVTIPLDQAGTWAVNNTNALTVAISLTVGATYQGTAGAWGSAVLFGTSNQFNFMGTVGNIFDLFDVSLTEGTVAPPFQVPDYASELAACQRYFTRVTGSAYLTAIAASRYFGGPVQFYPPMRGTPTVTPVAGYTALNLLTAPYADATTIGQLGFRAMAQCNAASDAHFNASFFGNARL